MPQGFQGFKECKYKNFLQQLFQYLKNFFFFVINKAIMRPRFRDTVKFLRQA